MFSAVYPAFQFGTSLVFKFVNKGFKYSGVQKIIQNCFKNPNNVLLRNFFCINSSYFFAGCCFSKKSRCSSERSLILNTSNEKHCDINPKNRESGKRFYDVSTLNMKRSSSSESVIEESKHDSKANKRRKIENISNFQTDGIHSSEETNGNELKCAKKDRSSVDVKRDTPDQDLTKKLSQESRKTKQRPNYFVAVKISNCEIHNALKEVQDHMLQQDQFLKPIMISLPTLHITLMVMHIGDEETHQRALYALEEVQQQFDEVMSKQPLELEIKGLGNFGNKVLFAKISENEAFGRLSDLADSVNDHFKAVSIPSTDTKRGFNPHLTVAKITFDKKCRHIKKINPKLYSCYNDKYFGLQTIKSIQLLSMTKPKDINGYYTGDEFFFSAFSPASLEHRLNMIEEQKKEVKERIQKLTQHLTK